MADDPRRSPPEPRRPPPGPGSTTHVQIDLPVPILEAVGRAVHNQVVTVAVAGTAVRAAASPRLLTVTLQAPSNNAGTVYVGGASVTNVAVPATQGFALAAGATHGPVALENAALLFVNADNGGDRLIIFGMAG